MFWSVDSEVQMVEFCKYAPLCVNQRIVCNINYYFVLLAFLAFPSELLPCHSLS